jgi:hypothetical protein
VDVLGRLETETAMGLLREKDRDSIFHVDCFGQKEASK